MRTWEIRIVRTGEQKRGARTRTVGTYRVFHDGAPAPGELLSGECAEARGPGSNGAEAKDKRRIAPGRYPLLTSGGPTYVTTRYRSDYRIGAKMPGIELRETGEREDVLIHPGKNAFLSAIGCINLCTRLPTAAERIDYRGSRDRVIAVIEDMKAFLGTVPSSGDKAIPNAFAVIVGEPGPPVGGG
jgi:hypothetical protein